MLRVTQLVNGKRKESRPWRGWRHTFEEVPGVPRAWLCSLEVVEVLS